MKGKAVGTRAANWRVSCFSLPVTTKYIYNVSRDSVLTNWIVENFVISYWCQGQPIGPNFKVQAVKYCLGPLRLSNHEEEEEEDEEDEEEEEDEERTARDMLVKVVKFRKTYNVRRNSWTVRVHLKQLGVECDIKVM